MNEETDVGPAFDFAVPGTMLLGKYRVEASLGAGGSGRVLKARHVELDQVVAIKLLRDELLRDVEHIRRFVREAQAASQLTSDHVVHIRDVGRLEDGEPYIVMELLEGHDLAQHLAEHGPCDLPFVVNVLLQACRGLAEAHALGMVHRDVKPSNLFLATRADGSQIVKVLDFGIAKVVTQTESGLTSTMDVLGTPKYMSPEQTRSARTVDARSDIWSLGAVLYELVEGTPPFEADSFAELCVKIATESPPPIKRAPKLAKIAARCLRQDADDRYQNVAELARDLAAAAPSPAASAHVAAINATLGVSLTTKRSHRARWLALGTLAVAIAGAAVVVIANDSSSSAPAPPAITTPKPPPPAPPPAAAAAAPVAKTVAATPDTIDKADVIDKAAAPPPPPKHKKPHAPPAPRVDPAGSAAASGSAKSRCDPYNTTTGC